MTAISVSERLLEMAAFYTWLDFTLTYKVLFTISFDGYVKGKPPIGDALFVQLISGFRAGNLELIALPADLHLTYVGGASRVVDHKGVVIPAPDDQIGLCTAEEKACGHFRKCNGGGVACAAFAGACVGDHPDLAVSRPRQRRLQRRRLVGIAFQRRVDLVPVVIEFLHQNAVRPRPAGQRFDPRRDPRTEKTGRKQRNKAYPRVRKSCGKPALFSQNPVEGRPIESSHA